MCCQHIYILLYIYIYNISRKALRVGNPKAMMMTKQKTNSKFTKAASLAASLALVLNGGVKFASAYDEQSIVCEHKTAQISCPTGELIIDGWYVFLHRRWLVWSHRSRARDR